MSTFFLLYNSIYNPVIIILVLPLLILTKTYLEMNYLTNYYELTIIERINTIFQSSS
jgi:hypothetical protein